MLPSLSPRKQRPLSHAIQQARHLQPLAASLTQLLACFGQEEQCWHAHFTTHWQGWLRPLVDAFPQAVQDGIASSAVLQSITAPYITSPIRTQAIVSTEGRSWLRCATGVDPLHVYGT